MFLEWMEHPEPCVSKHLQGRVSVTHLGGKQKHCALCAVGQSNQSETTLLAMLAEAAGTTFKGEALTVKMLLLD